MRSLLRPALAAAMMLVAGPVVAAEPGYYGYGRTPTAAEISGWDIDVRGDDGAGLPAGRGNVQRGGEVFADDESADELLAQLCAQAVADGFGLVKREGIRSGAKPTSAKATTTVRSPTVARRSVWRPTAHRATATAGPPIRRRENSKRRSPTAQAPSRLIRVTRALITIAVAPTTTYGNSTRQ